MPMYRRMVNILTSDVVSLFYNGVVISSILTTETKTAKQLNSLIEFRSAV